MSRLIIAKAAQVLLPGRQGPPIASTPGYHSGADLHSFGVNRVAAVLAKDGDAAAQRPDDQIYCQFSSFSSPTNPLAALSAAFHAPKPLNPPPPRVPLSIVWPTAAEVCASVEGYGAGGALPSAQKNVDKAPREMLCRWTKDGSSDFVTARRRDAAHQDLDARVGRRLYFDGVSHVGEPSGGAWGTCGRRPTLHIMHWELGVPARPDPGRAAPDDAAGRRHRAPAVSLPASALRSTRAVLVEARHETPHRRGKHGTR